MTASVCPVHGEYSATGVCRWCEEPKFDLKACDDINIFAGIELPPLKYVGCACGEFALNGKPFEFVLPNMLHQPHRCAPWLTLGMGHLRSPPSWRMDYDDPVRVAELDVEEGARLAAQHAALRWERVARRWNYKHRGPGGLDERGRDRVWMHWLDQMERRYMRLTWKLGEPP